MVTTLLETIQSQHIPTYYLPTYRQRDRHTYRQTDRHRDIHTDKQTDRHTYIKNGFEKYIRLYVFVNSYFFLQFKT